MVTGGAGFIGSNLVDRLVDRSAEVLVIDNLSNGTQHNLDAALAAGARLEQLDVRDRSGVQEAMTAFRPTTVFHLAAQIDTVRQTVSTR